MLKPHYARELVDTQPVGIVYTSSVSDVDHDRDENKPRMSDYVGVPSPRVSTCDVFSNFKQEFVHLIVDQQKVLVDLMWEYISLCTGVPGDTSLIVHDVHVGIPKPIEKYHYGLSPGELARVCEEFSYLVEHNLLNQQTKFIWSEDCTYWWQK